MRNLDEIISNYLRKEISLEEQRRLKQWLDQDPINQEVLKKIEIFWIKHSSDFKEERDQVEDRIMRRIRSDEQLESKSNNDTSYRWLKVAAILVLCLSAAALTFWFSPLKSADNIAKSQEVKQIEKKSVPGQKVTTFLSDGTVVKLNSGSRLIVPEPFTEEVREVELYGEAFFEVAKEENRPFIIKTRNSRVSVLGTSFNINSSSTEREQVAVLTGRVMVKSNVKNELVYLEKNEMVDVLENGSVSSIRPLDESVFGWISQQLVFKDSPFREVLKDLELWYGVKISVEKPKTYEGDYTARFNNPRITEVLMSLSKLYGFNYKIKNDGNIVIL